MVWVFHSVERFSVVPSTATNSQFKRRLETFLFRSDLDSRSRTVFPASIVSAARSNVACGARHVESIDSTYIAQQSTSPGGRQWASMALTLAHRSRLT